MMVPADITKRVRSLRVTKAQARKLILHFIVLLFVVALALTLARFVRDNDLVQNLVAQYGYLGIFILAFVTGFNLVAVAIPAVTLMPFFLASGLNFWLVIIFITCGMTLADTTAYILSRLGRKIASSTLSPRGKKILLRLEKLKEKFSWGPIVALFLFASVAPVPNETLLIPMGFLNYQMYKILPAVFAGNFVFNTLYATGLVHVFGL